MSVPPSKSILCPSPAVLSRPTLKGGGTWDSKGELSRGTVPDSVGQQPKHNGTKRKTDERNKP